MEDKKRTATVYLILERPHPRRWGMQRIARVVKHSATPPHLQRGQCAVKVSIEVPDAAFEPVLAGPSLAFQVEDVLRATATKEKP